MSQSDPNAEITKLMDNYKKNINQQDTADEMNRNTQHLYVYDYIYMICKLFLFIILGVVYYAWVGKKEVEGAYETTKAAVKETAMKASEKLKDIAPKSNATRS